MLLILIWSVIILYFNPRQEQFYLVSDVDEFEKKSNWALTIFETGLFAFILVLSFIQLNKAKEILNISFYTILGLFLIYIFFHSTIAAVGLYVNRQTTGKHVKKGYIVQYLNQKKSERYNFFLVDMGKKESVIDRKLLDSLYAYGFNQNDTIFISFTKGLLGVNYFNKIIVTTK